MKFDGKVVIVTGGAQGIGMAVSSAFVREGAATVIVDIDEEAGREHVKTLEQAGGNAYYVHADVANEHNVKSAVTTTLERYGRLDVLVNNAGVGASGTIFNRSMEEWDRVISINLRAPYMFAKYCAEDLANARGCIINIASTRALMSEANTEPYSASKGGLLALTHSLAVSLGPQVRVNAISPGWIDVSEYKKRSRRRPPELTPRDHQQHPVGRVGTPEDIAEACLFLASSGAGFITGGNFVIDGGMTVKMIYED